MCFIATHGSPHCEVIGQCRVLWEADTWLPQYWKTSCEQSHDHIATFRFSYSRTSLCFPLKSNVSEFSGWFSLIIYTWAAVVVALGLSPSIYLFIYLRFLMLILLLYTLGKLLFKLLSCLDKNKKACGGNIHVLCVWARLVIFNHSC